jgi:transglutaminase-like putative cysteine protease
MRLNIQVELDYFFSCATDVLLAIEVAQTADQRLVEDLLRIGGAGPLRPIAGEEGVGRRTWLTGEGPFHASYRATVDVERAAGPIDGLGIEARRDLPSEVIPYLWPSRYCESDRFEGFVERKFGAIAGGAKVAAMADWIHREIDYTIGSSDANTTAADAFVARQGVCRDYAHLLASFARAAGVPARLVSAYALKLEPPDFHAVVEVWLGDAWRLVDATRLAPLDGIVRICVGRDATDIAFMTSFDGVATMNQQKVEVSSTDG